MTLIVAILFLLIVSRVAAELAERVGQPAMIGEILAGLILGPALLGLIHASPELAAIADIGLLMLVLLLAWRSTSTNCSTRSGDAISGSR